MMWNLVSVAAVALAGFADPQGQAQPARLPLGAPDRISYVGSGNGWTGGRTEWWIDHSGRGGIARPLAAKRAALSTPAPKASNASGQYCGRWKMSASCLATAPSPIRDGRPELAAGRPSDLAALRFWLQLPSARCCAGYAE